MKALSKLPYLFAACLLIATVARATSFNYQYTFGDGTVVNGSLDGTVSGNFVTGVDVTSMFFNGTEITGPIKGYALAGNAWIDGPVVSFDVFQNNFLFIDGDISSSSSASNYFYMLNDSVYFANVTNVLSPTLGVDSAETSAGSRWSLQAASVPDGGMTVVLLGLSMFGLAGLHRKLRA